jgi:hypothetical protein
LIALLALFAACNPLPDTIALTGVVGDTPYGGGGVVGGATVSVLDDAYAAVDSQDADSDGAFSVALPAGVLFYLTVEAEGYAPTAFSGVAGLYDSAAPEGYPWVASDAWMAELREEFAACPTVADAGTVVAGEVRGYISGVAYTDLGLIPTGTARVLTEDNVEYAACYLDDTGVSTADGTVTGATGRFAIFGVPAGPILVEVRYTDPGGVVPVEVFQFVAPDTGLVPLYPALVQLQY